MIDETHDGARQSWVASANGHSEFPLQNLPLGVFSPPGVTAPDARARGGMAIGDMIFDLRAANEAGLLTGLAATAAAAASGPTLNALMALGAAPRRALRRQVFALLAADGDGRAKAEPLAARLLHKASACWVHLPASIGNFTDFFAGIHHATNGGRRRDPNNPLTANYKYVPVAYHSRASSVRESHVPLKRPHGQRKLPDDSAPIFGPCRKLDYELELAVWVGPGNKQGAPVPIGKAGEQIVGLGLVNDWSARDIQQWESQPLGPFLGKSFGSTVSPWIITAEALEPFRVAQAPRPEGDPHPLPHLLDDADQRSGAYDIALEAAILTPQMREKGQPAHCVSRSNTTDLYWTVAQLVAHHTSGGCNLMPGDLFGSGTISGPTQAGWGSLSEQSGDGSRTISLDSGEIRSFLEDGDEVIFRAHCRRDGYAPIGFGECRAQVKA
ncbi:MAG TPA: fumarylacetoacetase [Stellaceae bacterium]|jgi:fumarylacetoacetase|nr:fumarylacetoacetase [Stellaceae bacterium]